MRCSLLSITLVLAATNGGVETTPNAVEGPAIPVYADDLDRPYRIIGEIKGNLRKHFAFQADPTEQHIYSEIWERGRKMGADAVIHARYGPTKTTMFNYGRTPISGTAVKFVNISKDQGE